MTEFLHYFCATIGILSGLFTFLFLLNGLRQLLGKE